MEEDSSAKVAPVTRLRRRLSVEPEDSPLPTTPSTPSKKRSTRLAAKPQLELIDEVATENVPKRTTRKTTVKEVESEATGTPTPVTPSRRSTRVKSNTSLLSETIAQSVESPRAKRALRRNSQLGSDNESGAPITPARQKRQTRKGSTTSVEKQAATPEENITVLTITSTETTTKEETQKDPKTNKDNADSPSIRKSPRLKQKSGNTDETDNIHIETAVHSTQDKNPVVPITSAKDDQTENNTSIHIASPKENKTEIEMLSTSSVNLINDIKTSDKKTTSLNKSTTSIDQSINDLKNKRNRTKSWTTLTASPLNVELSDGIENSAEKLIACYRSMSGSGDGVQHSGNSSKLEELEIKSHNKSINKSKTSLLNTSVENKENIVVSEKPLETSKTDTMKLFENSPLNQKPTVIIEDSDSGSYDKLVMDVQIEGEDQCVPVGNPTNQTRKESFEPMDIDETMPENVTIDDFSDKSNASKDEIEISENRKSSITEKSLLNDKSIIKSKRTSSISNQASDTSPRNSLCEDDKNKSTPKQLLNNTQNSSKNDIDINKSRKNSVSFKEEKIENVNESKRKSSVYKIDLETSQNESVKLTVKSPRKSSSTLEDDIEKVQESINKSKKNVSMSQNYCEIDQVEKSLNKSRRKSSTSIVDDNLDKLYESCNNVSGCQNKSEIKLTEEVNNKSINKSERKTSQSLCKENNSENLNEISNKSNRKSFNSQTNSFVEENNGSKIANKSEKISHSQTESAMLEKSENENKSTLVISQFKDVSTNDINNVTSQNLTNELSEVVSGPEVKNKVIDKINLSPKSYLTSTPIQQKSLQKMAMQINTSIISPAVENKNLTIEKTPKLNGIEEEINLKNKKILSRAQSSSASSNEETEPKSISKLGIKKSPKKISAPDRSESDIKPESPRKMIKKKIPKRVQALDSSSDENSDIAENQQKIPEKQIYESKVDAKKVKTPNKKAHVSSSSDSDESEEEVSKDKNKMFDDEASEASDDYESGDSRSDGERQYEDDNEILEKGETLDSEEELSNDSDYERDSFIVSSDAEDNEILSGTGDDLSMSDNELTMSAKSKKKYNERKLKQQKKASREMYDARHKNDSAASSKAETSKSKKSKRQRLESSTLESENDSKQTKKNNRLRIDSSQESTNSADESIRIKKKKSKRLSESVCETTINEKEISLFNQTTEKNDPLTAAIKQEPKTPQKGFNISTVAINDNIEEVQVDSNASLMEHSDTLDPLQATMAVEDENDEDSLSENNEVIENYDSVLNSLNLQTNKLKTHDSSLNFNKKVKHAKNPVIDQLNLTQTKKLAKNKNAKNQQAEPVKSETKENVGMEEEDSSDAIDMKLLFPEDSNDSEANASKFKPEGNKPSEPDTIIPLKRTEAKTNLLDKTDMDISLNESSLNGSKKKNKKRKTSQSSQLEESMILDNGIKIIVDTIGTYEEVDSSQGLTNSSKKKNKKNKSLNETAAFDMAADIDCTDGFTLTEVETSITTEKKKKKNKNKSFDESMKKETSINVSGSHSENKSRKKSQSTSDFIETTENRDETIMEEMLVNTSIKSEKKKKNKSASVIAEPDVETQSAKKKTKKISISQDNESQAIHDETIMEEMLVNTSIKSEKKKKNKSASVIAEPDVETQSAKKKTKKISISQENESQAIHDETIMEEMLVNTSIKSEKKKKNKSASVIAEPDVETQSAKKKTKKISISQENESQAIHDETIMEEILVNTSIKSEKKKKNKSASVIAEPDVETQSAKKKTKKISISQENESQAIHEETIIEEIPVNTSIKSEKKKKKSASVIAEPDVEEALSAKKKSKKISNSQENKAEDEETMVEEILMNTSIKSEKKKKNKNASVIAEPDVEETQSAKKKSKKISISKENKSQAVHDESDDAPEEVSYKSAKKSDVTDNVTDDAVTTSTEKKIKKNKKKKNKKIAQSGEKLGVANAPTDQEDSELGKRKRKVSNNPNEADDAPNAISMESVPTRNQKKKRRVNLDDDYAAADNNAKSNQDDTTAKKSKKDKSKKHLKEDIPQNNAKKRKNRDNDDSVEKISKVSKQDSFDEIHVPRLPETVLKQLTGKPTKKISASTISTMSFLVEKGGRKNKPSEYLEQSVYLNNSPVKKKKRAKHTNPKVLPFTPTALTSDNGCTSRFNISLLPKDTQFVAQASITENFKEAFLGTQRIKKMGTLEHFKIQRSHKLSKF